MYHGGIKNKKKKTMKKGAKKKKMMKKGKKK